ncbi:PREDICTED: lysosomal acid lipase/cholesteryl ester hydrolase-like, partial [Nicrophorus vespilloides]|uniref:Lipase n=1 Tax=Nicrophorus vespilloides TaxID=110193 RepID=A0ABM1NDC3_NICVS
MLVAAMIVYRAVILYCLQVVYAKNLMKEIVESYGYPIEEYKDIQTPNGYFLTLHRIPYGRKMTDKVDIREPVFLMHGLFASSVNFVFAGPNISIAYQLADRGYDVWMGNARTTSYSKKHAIYDIKSFDFWNFTIDDLAVNDLGTSIDYVLRKTNRKQLTYMGHSHGNTIFAILLNERPEFNEKIKLYVGLAPAMSFTVIYHPWLMSTSYFIPIFRELGMYEFPPMLNNINDMMSFLCHNNVADPICIFVIELSVGSEKSMNKTATNPFFQHLVEGISYKNFQHLAQIYFSDGKLRKFDFGINENIRIYGKAIPPDYEINQVRVPTAIYYAYYDWLNSREDIAIVVKELPNIVDDYLIPQKVFNHFDFLWARNIKELLYNRIINLIDS